MAKRTTRAENARRIREAQRKLNLGWSKSDVALIMATEYGVSNTAANQYADKAMIQSELERNCHWIEDAELDIAQNLIPLAKSAQIMANKAYEKFLTDGDPAQAKVFATCVRQIEVLRKMTGTLGAVTTKNEKYPIKDV